VSGVPLCRLNAVLIGLSGRVESELQEMKVKPEVPGNPDAPAGRPEQPAKLTATVQAPGRSGESKLGSIDLPVKHGRRCGPV
jgi:hypothetical protein